MPLESWSLATGRCAGSGRSIYWNNDGIVDYATLLERVGADSPSNMQWQTKQAAKENDAWE